MPVVKLDANFIANSLICPPDKLKIEYCCEEVKGLFICVTAATPGRGTWYYRTKNSEGITQTLKIGRSTDLSIKDVKIRARALRSELELNRNDFFASRSRARDMPTFREFFHSTYAPVMKLRNRSWVRKEQLFKRLDVSIGGKRIDKLTRHDIVSFLTVLQNSGELSAASVNHHQKLVSHVLSMCIENGLVTANVAARIKHVFEDNKIENYLDSTQLEKLLNVLNATSHRLVSRLCVYLLSTGARLSEATGAKWSDINIETRVWRIPATNSKSRKVRVIPLNTSAINVLNEVGGADTNEYIFTNPKTGKPYVNVNKIWLKLRREAGVPKLRLHDLRHQYASFLVNSGRTLYEVQKILGHSNPSVTERYAHLSTKTLQAASDCASDMILNAMQSKADEVVQKAA